MPLIRLDAEQAMFSRNKHRKWPSFDRAGGESLRPITRPYYHPRIKIEKGDQVFAMGSCFARQLEDAGPKWLGLKKVSHFNSRSQNKYNIHSVLNQIKWAYGLDDVARSYSGILPKAPNELGDYHGHSITLEDPFEEKDEKFWTTQGSEAELRASRGRVNAIFETMRRCNFIVITLGLAEAWFDRETGLVLNETPSAYTLKQFPKRFEFLQFEYDDIMRAFDEIYAIFTAHNEPNFKLLFTVSPIPYESSFSPNNGAIAGNCYSKSVQRAAVEAFMARHDNVGYFPSYEMATHSDNKHVWDHDNLHVTAEFAAYILAHALNCLLSDELLAEHPEISSTLIDERMYDLFKDRDFHIKDYNPKKDKEIIDMRTDLQQQYDAMQARLIEETQKILTEKEQTIAELTRDRDRLAEEKNALYVEKLKRELGVA